MSILLLILLFSLMQIFTINMKTLFPILLLSLMICLNACSSDQSVNKKTTIPSKTNTPKNTSTNTSTTIDKPKEEISISNLSSTIDINNIDLNILKSRLLQKINKERTKLGLTNFSSKSDLNHAAKIHNDYMLQTNILDHSQTGTSTPNMMDRIKKAGGNYRTAGENIQYEGFTIRTTNGVKSIIAPSYEKLAEDLWQNWKTSPPHYKNLINPDFKFLGTSIGWSDKKTAMFATQVYGG